MSAPAVDEVKSVKKRKKKKVEPKTESALPKQEAMDLGYKMSTCNDHTMGEYRKNGKGLMIAKCEDCGARTIVKKKPSCSWIFFGTASDYTCERM